MAVPTVTRVLPYGASISAPPIGPTAGGALVEIYGSNFRLPNTAADVLNPFETSTPSVSVTFAGSPAPSVSVVRSNLLRVVTPPSALPFDTTRNSSGQQLGSQGWIEVEVTNLDPNGDPIPGENAAAPHFAGGSGAYAYTYPGLTSLNESTTTRIVDTLIDIWRRDVLPNTLNHQSVEFDSMTEDGLDRIDPGELPAIALLGPRTTTDRIRQLAGVQNISPANIAGAPPETRILIARMPYTLDLAFDVIGMASSRQVALNLMHVAMNYVQRTPKLIVPRCPINAAAGIAEYDLDFEDQTTTFSFEQNPNESDLHVWRGSIAIRGVHIENVGILGDSGVDAVPPVEEIIVDYCKL